MCVCACVSHVAERKCVSHVSPESHLQPSSSSRRPLPNTPEALIFGGCVRASRSPAAPRSRSRPAEQRPPHFAGVLLFFYLFRSAFLPHFLILFTEPQPEETAAHLHLYRKMYCIAKHNPPHPPHLPHAAQKTGLVVQHVDCRFVFPIVIGQGDDSGRCEWDE